MRLVAKYSQKLFYNYLKNIFLETILLTKEVEVLEMEKMTFRAFSLSQKKEKKKKRRKKEEKQESIVPTF